MPNDALTQYLNWLDDQQEPMLQATIELCNINSGTYHLEGIDRVKQKLVEMFEPLGGELTLVDAQPQVLVDDSGVEVNQPLGQIIHIKKHPDVAKKVMLCIHMDTVYGPEDEFQTCEFTPGGRLNGPGVADAKGGLVVMLNALKTLEQSPLAGRIGWEVIINPDEEIGSPGSASLMRSRASHCDFGLLFEPALPGGKMVSWRKGAGNFTFVVKGKSAHSGRDFAAGRNAIAALARLIDEIDRLNTEQDVTFNVGRISGGGPLNMVPDLAIGRVNVRVKDLSQQSSVEIDFADLVEKYNQLDGITVEMYGAFSSPPKPIDKPAEAIQKRVNQCGQMLGMELEWQGTGGGCDGNKFADAGLPNVDTMGPCGGNIHSHNEFLEPESLVPRTKLASLVLLSFAAEQVDDSSTSVP